MTKNWIHESLYPTWCQSFKIEKMLIEKKSLYQDIKLFKTAYHGRVLLLDGVVQVTEKDEFPYHEMITHVPLLTHGAAKRVLIIGAGDGGVLRHVLMHRTVEKAVMVEIDSDVIDLSKRFMPQVGGASWDDPRAEVIVGDGIAYVAKAEDASFDVIIVDSTDPIGVGEVLFTDAFYQECARILSPRGIIVNQCGVPFMQSEELEVTSRRRRQFFPHVSAYVVSMPTYVGGFMALGFASKDAHLTLPATSEIAARAQAAGLKGDSFYWSPSVQNAAFALPPYIGRCLPQG
ncbi:MAG: polyamine aminopropyltransferase [Acetobacteraceae bacterium]